MARRAPKKTPMTFSSHGRRAIQVFFRCGVAVNWGLALLLSASQFRCRLVFTERLAVGSTRRCHTKEGFATINAERRGKQVQPFRSWGKIRKIEMAITEDRQLKADVFRSNFRRLLKHHWLSQRDLAEGLGVRYTVDSETGF